MIGYIYNVQKENEDLKKDLSFKEKQIEELKAEVKGYLENRIKSVNVCLKEFRKLNMVVGSMDCQNEIKVCNEILRSINDILEKQGKQNENSI